MGEQMGVLSNGGAQREGSVGPTTIPAPQGLAVPPTAPHGLLPRETCRPEWFKGRGGPRNY